jgi:ring-1,2-phenylacetyl-CoA epoxidase subunit PaaD
MGIITAVEVSGEDARVEITPTFVGCPALDHIKHEIIAKLKEKGIQATVEVSFREPWTSDRISARGREKIQQFGIGPPPRGSLIEDLSILDRVPCPRCGSTNTELKTPFGPTLCRSIHQCLSCQETFEQFKPI